MLDRLWDLLQQVFHALIPFVVLQPYERGVLSRLGRVKGELGPGFHWCWPFHIDQVFHEHVTPRTTNLAGLSTTTSDGYSIGFDAVVTWRISDIHKALFEVTDLKDAIADTCAGHIGTALASATWDEVRTGAVVDNLTSICRKRGWKWGVEIQQVQLSGVAKVRNIRLSHSGAHSPGELHITPNPSL